MYVGYDVYYRVCFPFPSIYSFTNYHWSSGWAHRMKCSFKRMTYDLKVGWTQSGFQATMALNTVSRPLTLDSMKIEHSQFDSKRTDRTCRRTFFLTQFPVLSYKSSNETRSINKYMRDGACISKYLGISMALYKPKRVSSPRAPASWDISSP